ncbi:MAG: glycosyltransferase family 4 protein [Acidobacteria bacterium]|nr:glycosyltransferase family 4 protein [Acidobacteriota bacterium]
MRSGALRVGIVADYREERWPSMDLVAEMLADHLPTADPGICPMLLRPSWRRRATALRAVGQSAGAHAVDRYSNRYGDYAWWLRTRRRDFDVFHVVDHSYAHLVHVLPPHRTVVTCHDIDAFRCLAGRERPVYRHAARWILSGLRRAAMVTCDTRATRDEIVAANLLSADRLVVIHNGVHRALLEGEEPAARAEVDRLAGPVREIELLHVGSTIPRKRIDVLLRTIALVRARRGTVSLLRAGGAMTAEQRRLAVELGIADAVVELPSLGIRELAALYRRAVLTLLPSDYEGFGLPVIESLASGTPVLASRIPALVEVGGGVAAYAEPGQPALWAECVERLLHEREVEPGWWAYRREQGRHHAAAFTWDAYAHEMAGVYRAVAARAGHGVAA